MTTKMKKNIFILFGLAIILGIFLMNKSNASSANIEGTKFDDWVVSCSKADEKTKTPRICLLSQQLQVKQDDSKEQQVIAIYQLGYFGPKKELKMIQTLPLGVSISAGTSIISSKNLIAQGSYTVCSAAGCQAIAAISEKDLKAMLTTEENSVAFMNIEGKQINLPISVKGLEKGLEFIKKQ